MVEDPPTDSRTQSWPVWSLTATVVVEDAESLAAARRIVEDELAATDRAASRFRADSELAAVNAAAGSWVLVSGLMVELLAAGLAAASATGGAVDPTLGAAMRHNGYDSDITLTGGPVGSRVLVRYLGPRWREVELDRLRRRVRVPAGVELDLGATAKALTADRAARRIHTELGGAVLVSLGGDLAVAGCGPRRPFPVVVAEDHRARTGPLLYIGDGGVATSTTTLRRWTLDGRQRHHLVDPATGLPTAGPWRTVTAAAATCLAANTATTAAVVLGERALGWLVGSGLPARLVGNDGTVRTVNGWPAEESTWAAQAGPDTP